MNNPYKRTTYKGKPIDEHRKVIINGIEYESITKAMEELKIGTKKIYQLLKEENNE